MNCVVTVVVVLCWIHMAESAHRCLSCATAEAVTHWNKFMKYRLLDSRSGTLLDENPCESPQYISCESPCYIFQITGKLRSGEDNQLFALAQGCSSGLFDDIPSDYRCIERKVPMRGRGGYFSLDGKYCFCLGELCTEYNEIWLKHNPNRKQLQSIDNDYSPVEQIYDQASASSSTLADRIRISFLLTVVLVVFDIIACC